MVRLPRTVSAALRVPLAAMALLTITGIAADAQQIQNITRQQQQVQTAATANAAPIVTRPAAPVTAEHTSHLVAEGNSKLLCEAAPDRVFVRHDLGTACIAYHATAPRAGNSLAVIYFEGDVPAADAQKPQYAQKYLANMRRVFAHLAERHGVRFVFIARPGLFGSSGNHASRRSAGEMLTMNAAVDAVKARLQLTEIVLAGQSGGSTVGAALLTLGRRDVSCAVLGSGLLSVVEIEYAHRVRERLPDIRPALLQVLLFDPTDRLDWIERRQGRRIFVLGDPTDTRTPFAQQRRFADRVRALGHHATAIEVTGEGEMMHGVAHHTLPAAALCARGAEDAAIQQAVEPRQRPTGRTVASQAR